MNSTLQCTLGLSSLPQLTEGAERSPYSLSPPWYIGWKYDGMAGNAYHFVMLNSSQLSDPDEITTLQMRFWYYSLIDLMPITGLQECWPYFRNVCSKYLPGQAEITFNSLPTSEARAPATISPAEFYSVPTDDELDRAMARIKANPQTRDEFKARLAASISEDIDDLLWDTADLQS